MNFLTDLEQRIDAVAALAAIDVADAARQSDEVVVRLAELGAELMRVGERLQTIAAGVAASRSTRDAGHGGLAQARGHRNAVALLQEVSGSSRADAAKRVRVGESLLQTAAADDPRLASAVGSAGAGDAGAAGSAGAAGAGSAGAGAGEPGVFGDGAEGPGGSAGEGGSAGAGMELPWHAPVDAALLGGRVTTAQADAILRGLGEPPVEPGADGATAGTIEAWRVAAEQLLDEAAIRTVEDLAAAGRQMRDRLDPSGAQARYLARHEARSFRMWTDGDGIHHAKLRFDDHGGAWMRAMMDSALRPRRGGPRFVDAAEAEKARALVDDPRSNEQLAYDLLIDVLQAGATAEAEKVFGARQPGVRLVVVKDELAARDASGRPAGVGHLEDGGETVPAAAVEQAICSAGTVPVTVDSCGKPLDVGREQRLFTPRQRIALAVRDGGCLWPGCVMRASYCEAHHIDEWAAHEGRTDVERGVLLCRYHHMNLHHRGYRIRRDGTGPLMLHPPDGPGIELRPQSPLRWRWGPPTRAA
ncbi:hypothetical protein GCM10027064_13910 [Microbacterium petrolearium]